MQATQIIFGQQPYAVVCADVKQKLLKKCCSKAIAAAAATRATATEEQEEKALGCILGALAPHERPQFMAHAKAWDMWEAIRKQYEMETVANVMVLQKELKEFRLEDGERLADYFTRFFNIRGQLKVVNEDVSDRMAIGYVLDGLPGAYHSIKTVLANSDKVKSVEDLKGPLMLEEKTVARSSASEFGLASTSYAVAPFREFNRGGRGGRGGRRQYDGAGRGNRGGRGGRGGGRGQNDGGFRGKCFYCKQEGHSIANCAQRIADEAAQRQNQQPAQQQRQAPAQQQRRHFIAAINPVAENMRTRPGEWLVDTGAEAHVTTSSMNLKTFTPVGGSTETLFRMPDHRLVRPAGMGSLCFSSSKYEVDVTIQKVHVVPEVKISLFSVKALSRELGVPVRADLTVGGDSCIEIDGIPALEVFERDGMFFVRDALLGREAVPAKEVSTVRVEGGDAEVRQNGANVGSSPVVGSAKDKPSSQRPAIRQSNAFERGAWKRVRFEMALEGAKEKESAFQSRREKMREKNVESLKERAAHVSMLDVERRRYANKWYLNKDDQKRYDQVLHQLEIAQRAEAQLLHRRMGHLGYGNVQKLVASGAVTGTAVTVDGVEAAKGVTCEPCAMGKQVRQPHPPTGSVTMHRLELVHMDLCGPLSVETAGGKSYFVTFYDDATKYSEVRLISQKYRVPDVVREVLASWERQTGDKVKCVQTDRGTEYVNEKLASVFREMGIMHRKTAPYSPEQNGAAERLNRTLLQAVRAMLIDAALPHQMWGEAVLTASFLRNLSPTRESLLTPWERFTGRKPDISKLRVFGSRAYVMVPQRQRGKLDPVAVPGVMVGYEAHLSAWRIWVPSEDRVHVSTDVTFDERKSGLPDFHSDFDSDSDSDSDEEDGGQVVIPLQIPPVNTGNEPGDDAGDGAGNGAAVVPGNAQAEGGQAPAAQGLRVSTRSNKGQNKALEKDFVVNLLASEVLIPETFEEAMASDHADWWREAMNLEIASLREKGTYTLEEASLDIRALGVKWVFSVKADKHGVVERFKARLVVKGFMQREGVDFEDVFAPVSRHATLRAFLAMVAAADMELHQLDVKTAFLNGDLEEEIFIRQPPGFEEGGPNVVARLHKALYGLRQASRAWHKTLHQFLVSEGFRVSQADPSLYIRETDGEVVYLLIYVDDVLIASCDLQAVADVKADIMSRFECRDMGEADVFLGMEIVRDRENLTLAISQRRMIRELVAEYHMESAHPKPVPLAPGTVLSRADADERIDREKYPYSELIGSLLYIAGCTRPDISQAVGVLTRHMSCPGVAHWKAAKEVVRYLSGTAEFGLFFGSERVEEGLVGFSDADHAGCVDSRKSTTGYVFTLHGGAICWASKLQRSVAVSTMEAEYMAASEASKEAIWLRHLLEDLGYVVRPVAIHCDNQSAIKVIKNPVVSTRSKHIEIRYHAVREQVARRAIQMVDCRTEDMVADMLTKALATEKFMEHRSSMGVSEV